MQQSQLPSLSSPTPTFRTELRRGFSLYNLSVGLLAAVAIGGAHFALTSAGAFPLFVAERPFLESLLVTGGLFAAISLPHIAAHAYFGWRFERGIACFANGDFEKALRLLAIVERSGIEHYDLHGGVRALVRDLRDREGVPAPTPRSGDCT